MAFSLNICFAIWDIGIQEFSLKFWHRLETLKIVNYSNSYLKYVVILLKVLFVIIFVHFT